ncbi:MAG: hypothetical protein DMF57_11700 [Acidobacteria bacterium]|nr:MAG: hypothetical protein DMF57_11700 [Acidobacteriota bacterium]
MRRLAAAFQSGGKPPHSEGPHENGDRGRRNQHHLVTRQRAERGEHAAQRRSIRVEQKKRSDGQRERQPFGVWIERRLEEDEVESDEKDHQMTDIDLFVAITKDPAVAGQPIAQKIEQDEIENEEQLREDIRRREQSDHASRAA